MALPRNEEYIVYDEVDEVIQTEIKDDGSGELIDVSNTTEPDDESTNPESDYTDIVYDIVDPEGDGNVDTDGEDPVRYADIEPTPLPPQTLVTKTRSEQIIIDNYDDEYLRSLHLAGYTFYVVYEDGTRDSVDWTEVSDPSVDTVESFVVTADLIGAATNQKFWDDTNGIHITEDDQNNWKNEYEKTNHGDLGNVNSTKTWHNILINSLGILLRRGLFNYVAMAKTGIAFYDSVGNESSNILAYFGSDGAQIGRSNNQHINLTSSGLDISNGSGVSQAFFGASARIGAANAAHAVINNNGLFVYDANGDLAKINAIDLVAVNEATEAAVSKSNEAAQAASQAASSASNAESSASQAASDASNAATSASNAANSASNAESSASQAAQAASNANTSASNANTSALSASDSARNALRGLDTVQDVVNITKWIADHKVLTTDTSPQSGIVYYEQDPNTGQISKVDPYDVTTDTIPQSGVTYYTNQNGNYIEFTGSTFDADTVYYVSQNPVQKGYYVLDEKISNYLNSHLIQTNYGLNLLVDDIDTYVNIGTVDGYKPIGFHIIDENGDVVQSTTEEYTRIGSSTGGHLLVKNKSLTFLTVEDNGLYSYFEIRDLKDNNGVCEVTENFSYVPGQYQYILSSEAVDTNYTVTVQGVSSDLYTVNKELQSFRFSNADFTAGTKITVVYTSSDKNLASLTFGIRHGAIGITSVAEGMYVEASGSQSHAEGHSTRASDSQSHAEGHSTSASGSQSHAEGGGSHATGLQSHAEGSMTTASGIRSHAEGAYTTASGDVSHAEGDYTTASGDLSHAEGFRTTASGDYSHAEGSYTTASGDNSHASGYYTISSWSESFVIGKYNQSLDAYFIIGNGSSDDDRRNAFVVDRNGQIIGGSKLQLTSNSFYGISEDNFIGLYAKTKNRSDWALRVFGGSDSSGDAIVIGDGGLTIVGGGESAENLYNLLLSNGVTPSNENMYLSSDGSVYVVPACNSIANRVSYGFSSTGLDMTKHGINNISAIELVGSSSSNGGYIDFHYNNNSDDYTSRIIEDSKGRISFYSANIRLTDTNGANHKFINQAATVNTAEAPEDNKYVSITEVQDKNGNIIGHDEYAYRTNQTISHNFAAVRQKVNGQTWTWRQCSMNVDINGSVTYGISYPDAFRSAINAQAALSVVKSTSGIVNAASGITITSQEYVSYGKLAMLRITFTISAAKNSTTTTTIATISSSDKRPIIQSGATLGISDDMRAAWVDTNGSCNVCASMSINTTYWLQTTYIIS